MSTSYTDPALTHEARAERARTLRARTLADTNDRIRQRRAGRLPSTYTLERAAADDGGEYDPSVNGPPGLND